MCRQACGKKRVLNFVGTEQVERTIGDIRDQTAGPRAQAARAALQSRGFGTDDGQIFAMMAVLRDPVQFPNGAADYSDALVQPLGEGCTQPACDFAPNSDDPLMLFTMSSPVNNQEAKIYGAEFAAQHFFGETGFGVIGELHHR